QKINLLLGLSVFMTGIFASPISSSASRLTTDSPDEMEVHFLDVGQGDSTLITCGGHAMLIDTGDDSKGTLIQNYLKKQNIEKLDYLILTHPDSDHIGGAPVIISKFEIDKVFVSNYEKDNKTYQKLIQALDNKGLKYTTPKTGSQYSLGTAEITILGPNREYDNPNDASVALLIQNGNNKFLFTGDATEDAENDILANNTDISADVYHAGHHGSKTSTSEDFFKAVSPAYAVISCEEGNSYGHPHAQTLNTFRMNGVDVYRTDEEGTVIAVSDGSTITFNVPASDTWKAGEPTGSAKNSTAESSASAKAENADTSAETTAQTESAAGNLTAQNQTVQAQEEALSNTESTPAETIEAQPESPVAAAVTYVLNNNTHKFHKPDCGSVRTIKDANREDTTRSRDEIIGLGYVPCKKCNP
ncbi:MAG: MBL fold metallo-hydrolase, partial [Lachnospiraceae bacterium]|nr:MBL fold metallo-hydrolase [Lachnospiraceae bacterium]